MTTSMKFRVKDEEHSKAIQKKLFSVGVRWSNSSEVGYTDKDYLYAEKYITWSNKDDSVNDYFERHRSEEYILLDGEFVPADSIAAKILSMKLAPNYPDTVVAEDFSPKPVVEGPVTSDGGSSKYYKLCITNRKGEVIECEVGDVIRCMVGDNHSLGNIIKACRRMYEAANGRGKAGTSMEYDSNKIAYFATEYAHFYGKK